MEYRWAFLVYFGKWPDSQVSRFYGDGHIYVILAIQNAKALF